MGGSRLHKIEALPRNHLTGLLLELCISDWSFASEEVCLNDQKSSVELRFPERPTASSPLAPGEKRNWRPRQPCWVGPLDAVGRCPGGVVGPPPVGVKEPTKPSARISKRSHPEGFQASAWGAMLSVVVTDPRSL